MLTLALLALSAPAADPVGQWRTPTGGVVELERCGAALCGRIVALPPLPSNPKQLDTRNADPAKRGQPLKGLTMLTGFTGGPSVWSGGRVYNPQDGHTYSGTITLVDARTLRLKGCAFAFFCKTQNWVRIR